MGVFAGQESQSSVHFPGKKKKSEGGSEEGESTCVLYFLCCNQIICPKITYGSQTLLDSYLRMVEFIVLGNLKASVKCSVGSRKQRSSSSKANQKQRAGLEVRGCIISIPAFSGALPPPWLHYLNLHKQNHDVETQCANTQVERGQFSLKPPHHVINKHDCRFFIEPHVSQMLKLLKRFQRQHQHSAGF